MVFGEAATWRGGAAHANTVYQEGSGLSRSLYAILVNIMGAFPTPTTCLRSSWGFVKELINAVKRLAVSTGKLSPLLKLTHPAYRPGSLPEPMLQSTETSSCGGFHAYMPSAFIPGRTWLPSNAASATTGTPEYVPSSPLVLEENAHISCAHDR